MRSFLSIFLFGQYLLSCSFIGTFCFTECFRFCLVAVPILARDYIEFGPDDPQTRFEFGAVVVWTDFHFMLHIIPLSAHIAISNRIIVTEIYFFLRKRFSLRPHWPVSGLISLFCLIVPRSNMDIIQTFIHDYSCNGNIIIIIEKHKLTINTAPDCTVQERFKGNIVQADSSGRNITDDRVLCMQADFAMLRL